MTKNLIFRLLQLVIFSFLLHSCRNDYIPEQNTVHNASNASKFRIVTLKEIPQVEEYLHKKTGRQDFSITLSKSAVRKENLLPSVIDPSFIIEKKKGSVTYYVFRMENMSPEKAFYTFEIKENNGVFERAEIIEYKPDGGFSGDPIDELVSFSGTVASYDPDGVKTAEQTYTKGYTPCPSDDMGGENDGGSGGGGIGGGGGWNSGGGDGNGSGSGGGGIGNGGGMYGGGAGGGSGGTPGPSGGSCGDYQLSHHLFSGGTLVGAVYINGCGQTKVYLMSESTNRLTSRCNDGSGVEVWDESTDPCEKAKSILDNPALQDKVGTLKGKVNIDGANEFGFKVNMDGTTTNVTEGKKREWDVGSLQGIKGFYHSHPGPGINIFSPPDIQSLFTNIITSGSPSTVSDIFIGVIGSENYSGGIKYFHYIIRYNGSIQDAGAISSTNYDMDAITMGYSRRENELASILPASPYSDNDGASLNHKGVEQLFFDTLDNMNINKNKMILQRVDDNGSVNTITLNSDGTTTAIPCP